MDVWSLEEKYKTQAKEIEGLKARIKYMEEYLSALTKKKEIKKDEKLQDKKAGSSRVRTRRSAAAKSKSN